MNTPLKEMFKGYKLVSLKTASVLFDISIATLRTWVANGTIPSYRVKRLVRVNVDDLLDMTSYSKSAVQTVSDMISAKKQNPDRLVA